MQLIKRFCQGVDFGGKTYNIPLEDQINGFLKENPTYTAKNMSFVQGPMYKEAYVIFDIRTEKKVDYKETMSKFKKEQ